jgi:hypothetical protein
MLPFDPAISSLQPVAHHTPLLVSPCLLARAAVRCPGPWQWQPWTFAMRATSAAPGLQLAALAARPLRCSFRLMQLCLAIRRTKVNLHTYD